MPFRKVKEIVSRDGVRHFRRWAILQTRWFNIYLHCIEQSDQDKDLHSHQTNVGQCPHIMLPFINGSKNMRVLQNILHSEADGI